MNRSTGRTIVVLFLGAAFGCRARQVDMVLSKEELALSAATGLPEALVLELKKAGPNLRQLEGHDSEGTATKLAGVTTDVQHDKALIVARRLQELLPPGHFAFVSDEHFGIAGNPDQVSVMRASDPFEIMRAMGTNGWNYDIGPEKVVSRLKEWDARYGLVFRGIGFDWVRAEFGRRPSDMLAFAREVYEFCPDVVDQGTETVEALASEMKRENAVYLWWD